MAARRGRSQARRHTGNGSGLPVWLWITLGIVLGIALVSVVAPGAVGLLAPKFLKSAGDGLWRPQPNPDARPAQAASDDEPLTGAGAPAAGTKPRPRQAVVAPDAAGPEYDFYTLLPGKEVALSDAELAATQRAEARRSAARQTATAVEQVPALPRPVEPDAAVAPRPGAVAPTSTAAAPDDGARYLLQAGAFEASGQAEELKARIALLGLGARVESARINDRTVYRVRMGPYGTASELAEAKRKLANGGLPAMAIKAR